MFFKKFLRYRKYLAFPIFFSNCFTYFVVSQCMKYTCAFTITIYIQLYNFLYLISLVFSIFLDINSNKSGALINSSALYYSLLENTFLFWNFVKVNLSIHQNKWAIKPSQTLDSNSKTSLIILKENLPHVLKKWVFMFIKYVIVRKANKKLWGCIIVWRQLP